MSRSIHTTWAQINKAKSLYRNKKSEKYMIRTLFDKMYKKREAKQSRDRHKGSHLPDILQLDPAGIPINRKESTYVRFPATDDDIRELMRRLPPGSCDGISEIRLRLGSRSELDKDPYVEEARVLDPFKGVYDYEYLPGVYSSSILGQYNPSDTTIRLYAYLYDTALPEREMWELFLKLQMLKTLIHEIGHHCDFMARCGQPRWLGSSRDRNEIYAENCEHDWSQVILARYLREKYTSEVNNLEKWIEHYGGIQLPLEAMMGDPRTTVMGEKILSRAIFGDIPSSISDLSHEVNENTNTMETRLSFAKHLRCGDYFVMALEIIDGILISEKDNIEVLRERAVILWKKKEYEAADLAIKKVLKLDNSDPDGWGFAAGINISLHNWEKALKSSDKALKYIDRKDSEWKYIIVFWIIAQMELGNVEKAKVELAELENNCSSWGKRTAQEIRTKYL